MLVQRALRLLHLRELRVTSIEVGHRLVALELHLSESRSKLVHLAPYRYHASERPRHARRARGVSEVANKLPVVEGE